jgi:penicillin amidase
MRFALLLLSGCSLTTLMTQKKSWPDDEGLVSGLPVSDTITIARDEWGIAHVRAQSENDIWFAEGFLHARDRLFQADLSRRLVFGGLVELRGESALPLERFMLGLELEVRSRAIYESGSPEIRAKIDRYTEGFNAGMQSLKTLPVEHRLTKTAPQPWQPWHCMALVWLNAWTLAENYGVELAALQLRQIDSAGMDALFRFDETEPPVGADWDQLRSLPIGAFTEPFKAFDRVLGVHDAGTGSNNWIAGPSRTASGWPIIANDPHLSQRVPSLWYPVDLGSPGLHVAGVSLPGSPFIVLGHNEKLAWGFTNVMADMVDMPVLKREGEGYLLKGEKKEFRKVKVEIPVGDQVDVSEQLWTELGPVITDPAADYFVVLQWQAFHVADHTTSLVYGLNTADTVAEAKEAVDVPTMVAQNLVVADSEKQYAWQSLGSFPSRVGFDGRLPYNASLPEVGWQGWLPPIPGEINPERGYVVTANSRPLTMENAWKVSTRYINDSRKRRIDEVISSRTDHTLDTMGALQYDRIDLRGRELSARFLEGLNPADPKALQCMGLLKNWDGSSDPDSVAASVWAHFQVKLVEVALSDDLGEDLVHYMATASPGYSLIDRDLAHFLPDEKAGVEAALAKTCTELEGFLGADTAGWTFGRLRTLALNHPFGGASALLSSWNIEATAYGGTPDTVNAAGMDWRDFPYGVSSIASMRLLMPLDDLAHSRFVHPGGAYGQPKHPHSTDMFPLWRDGQYATFWFSDADIAAHTQALLTLVK